MKRCLWLLLPVGLLLGADAPKEEVQKEQEKFQGMWTAVSLEANGQAAPAELLKDATLEIKGDKYTLKRAGATLEGTFKIDPAKKPKTIDISGPNQQGKVGTSLGIYELEGDTLKVCYVAEGGERPKEFSTKAGTPETTIVLTVYKRAKP